MRCGNRSLLQRSQTVACGLVFTLISRNFSHGYGPVEFLLKSVPKGGGRGGEGGEFAVQVELFNSMKKFTGTTVQVKAWTHFADLLKVRLS